MKKYIIAVVMVIVLASPAFCQEKPVKDYLTLFYQGNVYYEQRNYAKALESYDKILSLGLESGPLYYNIGNAFVKLGKLGYAILFYEKAKRIIPDDGDLKSNLAYVRTLTGDQDSGGDNIFIKILNRPFKTLNLNAMAIAACIFYLLSVMLAAVFILYPFLRKRMTIIFIASIVFSVLSLAAFALKYYDEVIIEHGVVVSKIAECKYEPIDASTTYYTLHEGGDVRILKKKPGWFQVRRSDGKIGWVAKDSVEEF